MEFRKYQHIMKLGTDEVDGILNGTVYLFYKIDGTNSQVFLKDDGSLGYGSRNREITPEDDNAGFAAAMEGDGPLKEELLSILTEHPSWTIYGEWLVPHTLKTYAADSWRKFYVFDVLDQSAGKYLTYEEYSAAFAGNKCDRLKVIPLMEKLVNPTPEDIEGRLRKTGAFLCATGLGEGIVIKNYSFVNRFGRTTWAKVLTEDFLSTKKATREENRSIKDGTAEHATERMIIARFLTYEHIAKEYSKICEKYGEAVMDPTHTFELLNRVFLEFWSDNWEIILNKMHFPTIDFRALKNECDRAVKEYVATLGH